MTEPDTAAVREQGRPDGGSGPSSARVLLADPDVDAGRELVLALGRHRVDVAVCADGAEALLRLGAIRPDLLIVSADLPGVDALTLIQVLRRSMDLPVLVGTGPRNAETAARALAAGATACVARPYRAPELLAFIMGTAAEPAVEPLADSELRVGPIRLDARGHHVRVDGRPLTLPLREFEILHYLMRHPGRVITRDELHHQVWRTARPPAANTINVQITRLRRRLTATTSAVQIRTVRGMGYRMDVPAPGGG
ncbi:DNA-binding response OmpR family regulator [Allonocardiopsis opalescens]|uniref:DNA-binding response OmpR family regulator n=2 Tax=Allonocardiopsis opalescens TaxID=1144618 RepID=A0A2T0Q592_9ACTN|nr:DNA-binding response OmpR family regulator [Allonocardiopsis opalescens]